MPAKKGLGKGLGALFVDVGEAQSAERGVVDFGHSEALPGERVVQLKLIDVEPNKDQPRQFFDSEALSALAQSITTHGVIAPILVQKTDAGTYRIIAGERRWRASKLAGLKEIPAIVKDYDELARMSVSLIENLQRENLNPIEEAEGFQLLMDTFGLTQEAVAERMGKSRSAIANSLRLGSLDDDVKMLVKHGELSAGHARTLVGIPSGEQTSIAVMAVDEQMSVRGLEQYVKELGKSKPRKTSKPVNQVDLAYKEAEQQLSYHLGAPVKLVQSKSSFKVEIKCNQHTEFDRIIDMLMRLK